MVSEAHLWHLHPVRFQTHGAGRQGDRDGGSRPDGWVRSQATLALQTQSQTMCQESTQKQQDEGARGGGGTQRWAGGHHRQKRENNHQHGRPHRKGIKQNRTKSKLSHFLSHPIYFFFSFSFSSSFSAWQANGIGSLLRMEKIIVVSYICTLQTEAGRLQCLC